MSTVHFTPQGSGPVPSDARDEIDGRFDTLVRIAFDGRPEGESVDFHSVFDMDYGQSVVVPRQRSAHPRTRPVVRPAPAPAARIRKRSQALRLTRRGRVVAVLAFLGLALTLMLSFGGWATASLSGGTPTPVRVVTVQPGDTLYGIASDVAQPGKIRDMVHRIQELNSLDGSSIAEGQKLAVPRG